MKVRGWKKVFHTNGNNNKAGVAILLPENLNFKTKSVIRDEEGYYVIITGSIKQEDITLVNIYAPNTEAPNT